MKKSRFIYFLLVIILFAGCAKDGEDGNANVQVIEFSMTNWNSIGNDVYEFDTTIAAITSDVVNKGLVSAFIRISDTPVQYVALPCSYVYEPGNTYSFDVDFSYSNSNFNNFRIQYKHSLGWSPGGNTFKVVIIPAN